MTSRALVTPVAGRIVRIPGSYKQLAAEGQPMEIDSYWIRKQKAGDVTIADEQPAKSKGDK